MHKKKSATEQEIVSCNDRVEAWMELSTPRRLKSDGIRSGSPASRQRHTSSGNGPMIRIHDSLQRFPHESTYEPILTDPPLATGTISETPNQRRNDSWTTSMVTDGDSAQRLRRPLRLRVIAKAELTEATLTSKDAIWTIAQIHAELPDMSTGVAQKNTGIAVAIVLDNSFVV
jgi:hypothetical protein